MAILLRGVGRYLLLASVVLIALFVLSQVAQLVALASTLSPAFGTVTAIILLLVLGGTVAVPVLGLLRLDSPLAPPEDPTGPKHEAFVKRYLDICRRNPLLADRRLDTEEDLVEALKHLETEAEKVVTATASRVFLGTAVSQCGALDAVVTGFTQLSMVWRIAHVFLRRPSLRQLGYLYANVLATGAAASQLDKVDIAPHLRPVLTSVLGQSVAALPGVSAASGFLTNALFQGTVNASLTLRIGMVAIAYSRATVRPERRSVWQGAVAKSAQWVAARPR